jgi:hypothetical protein
MIASRPNLKLEPLLSTICAIDSAVSDGRMRKLQGLGAMLLARASSAQAAAG